MAHGGRRTTRGQRRLAGRLTAAGEQQMAQVPNRSRKLNAKNEGKTHVCEIVRSVKRNFSSNKERNLKNGSV